MSSNKQVIDYADGRWYHDLRKQFALSTDDAADGSAFLSDNSSKRFLERYFDAVYIADMAGVPFNDLCLLRHSNQLFVVGLAPGHSIFRGCYSVDTGSSVDNLEPHTIIGLDYKVSTNVDRLDNCVHGRRKRGSQTLSASTEPIAFAICDRGVRHKLICGIPGRLMEVNKALALSQAAHTDGSNPNWNNLEPNSRLRPLGDPKDEAMGSYLCIIAPSVRRAKMILHSLKIKKMENDHQCLENQKNVEQEEANSTDAELAHEYSDQENQDLPIEREDPHEWTPVITELTKHKLLTWNEYANLRGL